MNGRRTALAALVVVCLGGWFLRAWGAGWSLPYVDHPDEPAVVNVVLRIVAGKFDPSFFFYPSLILYLQALVLKLHFWRGLHTGLYHAPLVLPRTTDFYTSIPRAFAWGRLVTATLSAATSGVLGLYSRAIGRSSALLAAALLAFSPWAITHAHYITVDAPAALFAAVAVLAAVRVLEHGDARDYLLAGMLAGLATGTKYQDVLVVVPLLTAHALRWRRCAIARLGRLVAAGVAAAATFLLTSPYVLLDFAAFRRDVTTLFASYGGAHGDVMGRWPLGSYLAFLWSVGLGPLPALLVLIGAIALGRSRPRLLAVLLAFPLLLLVTLLQAETHFFRNLLPAQPLMLLVAGTGGKAVWDVAARYLRPRLRAPVAVLGLLVVVAPSLVAATRISREFALPDSRVEAQAALRQQAPGVRVASELSHPFTWGGVAQSTPVHYLPLHTLDWYRQQGFGLLLATSSSRRQYAWTPDYGSLLQDGRASRTYGGPGSRYRGPQIDIIETRLTPATLPVTGPRAHIGALDLLGVTVGRLAERTTGPEVELGRRLRVGDVIAVTAFWTARVPAPPANYMLFLHLRNQQSQNLAQRDAPPWLGLFPPQSWQPGSLVVDRLDLPLPGSLPPGQYHLVMGLYDGTTQRRFPATAGGAPLPGDEVDLGTIEIGR